MQLPREHPGYCNVNMKCPPGPLLDEKIKLQGIEKLQEEKSTRLLSTALDIYTKKVGIAIHPNFRNTLSCLINRTKSCTKLLPYFALLNGI